MDELLRSEFGLKDGLADITTWGEMAERNDYLEIPSGTAADDAFIQILDPATGTGTFLVEVIEIIYSTMTKKWLQDGHMELELTGLWNDYVPKHLLPRLYGYELMMAPYAIAHMKVGLKLFETGYSFKSDERVRVYLTNSLEPPQDFFGTIEVAITALAHEAEAVNAIKENQRFTVVIGNPPYSKMSANLSEAAVALIEPFRYLSGERIVVKAALAHELNLQDDYVKFFRLAEYFIEINGAGCVGLITNHGFLDGATFRGMRRSLMNTFSTLHLIDLHGHKNKKETTPEGGDDENVFEIAKVVCISILLSL